LTEGSEAVRPRNRDRSQKLDPVRDAIAAETPRTSLSDIDRAHQFVKEDLGSEQIVTPPVVIAEAPHVTVTLAEQMTVTTTDHTARVVAVPLATVTSSPPSEGVPVATAEDETSDGVIRENLATAETPPSPRIHPPGVFGEDFPDDRPDDATGEIDLDITNRRLKLPLESPAASEPSILVTDIAAVHSQLSVVAVAQSAAPRTADAASPAHAAKVAEVRKDATKGFSKLEEDFFREGHDEKPDEAESFADLDEGYRPVGFWDRLLGRKPPPK